MGKKSTKTKSTSTPWAPAQPILTGAGEAILGNYNQNQGNLQSLTSGLTGGVIPGIQGQIANQGQQLQPGYNYINNSLGSDFLNANPANAGLANTASGAQLNSNPANSYLTSIADGKYLNANPYTTAMAKQAGQDAGNAVSSTFSSAGRTGSGNHATELAKGVSSAENQVFFQNYQNERALQNSALGQLGGNYNTAMGLQNQAAGLLGSNYNAAMNQQGQNAALLPGYSSSQFAGYSPLLGATQLAGQMPYYGANSLSGIGGLYGGYGQQTGQQPGGWLNSLIGAGASIGSAAIMASDIELKTKIEKLGEAKDGLGIYEWSWKSDPDGERARGVLAHEVAELRPWAHVPNFIGSFAGVNYAALGSME